MTLISRLFGKKTVPGSAQAVPDAAQVKAATDKAQKQQVADILEMPDGQDLRRLAGLLEVATGLVEQHDRASLRRQGLGLTELTPCDARCWKDQSSSLISSKSPSPCER